MKSQDDFDHTVKTLITKIKLGDEWKIDLSKELKRYQEYAVCSNFGASTDYENIGSVAINNLQGSFLEAGLVVENASLIYSMRVDDAFESIVNCADSLRKSVLNVICNVDKASRDLHSKNIELTSPTNIKKRNVGKVSIIKNHPKNKADKQCLEVDSCIDLRNELKIKVTPHKRRLIDDDDNELYDCMLHVPIFLLPGLENLKNDIKINPNKKKSTKMMTHEHDYGIHSYLVNEFEELEEDELEDAGDPDDLNSSKEINEIRSHMSSPTSDSGFGSSSSDGCESLSDVLEDFEMILKDLAIDSLSEAPGKLVTQNDIVRAMQHVKSVQKNLESILNATPMYSRNSNIQDCGLFARRTFDEIISEATAQTNASTIVRNMGNILPAWLMDEMNNSPDVNGCVPLRHKTDIARAMVDVEDNLESGTGIANTWQQSKLLEIISRSDILQKEKDVRNATHEINPSQVGMSDYCYITSITIDGKVYTDPKTLSTVKVTTNDINTSKKLAYTCRADALDSLADKMESGSNLQTVLNSLVMNQSIVLQNERDETNSTRVVKHSGITMKDGDGLEIDKSCVFSQASSNPQHTSHRELDEPDAFSNDLLQYNILKLTLLSLTSQKEFELPEASLKNKLLGFLKLPLERLLESTTFTVTQEMKQISRKRNYKRQDADSVPQKVGRLTRSTILANKLANGTSKGMNIGYPVDKPMTEDLEIRSDSSADLCKSQAMDQTLCENGNYLGDNHHAESLLTENPKLENSIKCNSVAKERIPTDIGFFEDVITDKQNVADESTIAQNTSVTVISSEPNGIMDDDYDDYPDEGIDSPGSYCSSDSMDSPPRDDDIDKDNFIDEPTPLSEILPTLQMVSMVNRLQNDCAMLGNPAYDSGYETCDSISCPNSPPNSGVLDSMYLDMPIASTPETTRCLSEISESLNDISSITMKQRKKMMKPVEVIQKIKPVLLPCNLTLTESYRIEDEEMDDRIQDWAQSVKPSMYSKRFSLAKCKKGVLTHLSRRKKRISTMTDVLRKSKGANGRILLATLLLINEKKVNVKQIQTNRIGDPNFIFLRTCGARDSSSKRR